MKKLFTIIIMTLILSSCASFNKAAKYPKGTQENTDWRINKL